MPGPWSTCPRRSGGSTPGRLWSWGPENSCGTCPLAFGESDGAVRVKAILNWKPLTWYRKLLGLAAAALVMLLFVGIPAGG